jgi:hypothetical protein
MEKSIEISAKSLLILKSYVKLRYPKKFKSIDWGLEFITWLLFTAGRPVCRNYRHKISVEEVGKQRFYSCSQHTWYVSDGNEKHFSETFQYSTHRLLYINLNLKFYTFHYINSDYRIVYKFSSKMRIFQKWSILLFLISLIGHFTHTLLRLMTGNFYPKELFHLKTRGTH